MFREPCRSTSAFKFTNTKRISKPGRRAGLFFYSFDLLNGVNIDHLDVYLKRMSVKVSSKYQVVIPESVREALKLRPGTQVDVIAKGGIAYLVPVRSISVVG